MHDEITKTKSSPVRGCPVAKKWLGLLALSAVAISSMANPRSEFAEPPLTYATRPLWFWNNTAVTEAGVVEQMAAARDQSGYGGFGILPFKAGFQPEYLSEEYFSVYGAALAKAEELGMTMCIYDEFGFPSGSAGARNGDGVPRFKNAYPEYTIKRLDKTEVDLIGPTTYSATIPSSGTLMSWVAMEVNTLQRVNLTGLVDEAGALQWSVPSGQWKIMTFMNVPTDNALCDYLDPEACQLFVDMTHQEYYDRFSAYFGTTVDGTFFDEPTIYHEGGRVWTGAFNEKFIAKHGFDPAPYYPALWYDIGEETEAARNYLFGFRAELYARGFPKVIQDWATAHGITATGHQDQEEIVNQTAISGDLMLSMKHQDIPGIDKIGGRAAERVYKVISSAAYNWDKALVMSETYGAMGNISWDTIYQVAMDQYTAGINQLIPHAVWYDDNQVTYKPELSWQSPIYADGLPQYNAYMSRLNALLQNEGRHVADIAVLYPVRTMHAEHYMDGPLGQYAGGVAIPELDYLNVSDVLINGVGRDFTFLHPEVLDGRTTVDGDTLKLNNAVNYEEYKVMIMPGQTTISWSNLEKIKSFYDQGGKVVATGTLPSKSAEFGHDADVVSCINEMFPGAAASNRPSYQASSSWAGGGYGPKNAFDASMATRWNAADGTSADQWLEVDFGKDETFNKTVIKEAHDRVTSYEIQYYNGSSWVVCASGSSIGASATNTFATVTASKVRLYINSISSDSASIYEFECSLDDGLNLSLGNLVVSQENANGGMSYFIRVPTESTLRSALDDVLPVYDVEFVPGEELRYIHTVKDGKELFFFANPGSQSVRTWVELRGRLYPELWNPHTGVITPAEYEVVQQGNEEITRIRLDLDPVKSTFVVALSRGPMLAMNSLTGAQFQVQTTNMVPSTTYTLQAGESLLATNWVGLASTSGVESAQWMIPATNEVQFFRMSGESPSL